MPSHLVKDPKKASDILDPPSVGDVE